MYSKNTKNKYRIIKPAAITVMLILVLFLVFLILQKEQFTHFFQNKQSAPITAGQDTKGEGVSLNTSQNQSQISSPTPSNSSSKTASSSDETSAHLLSPTGNFVSDHAPNLGGSPRPNSLTSDCTTTPGATCVITFTDGSVSKSLSSQIINQTGTAYWNWTLQQVGLTVGTWKIEATASLNGQSISAIDANTLQVSP